MKQYGLLGYPLGHSFSKKYFTDKFTKENIDATFVNYELPAEQISSMRSLYEKNKDLCGTTVTIPHKQSIMPFLDEIDNAAVSIGAVNVVKPLRSNGEIYLVGYNTDCIGFEQSLLPILPEGDLKALVLGTGGAAKAVVYVLDKLNIPYKLVSRTDSETTISYEQVDEAMLLEHLLIINTTPLGMYPMIDTLPQLPYSVATKKHLFYDLVYNPADTAFMKAASRYGANTKNGLEMLHLQAEAAWSIWQDPQ